MEDPIVVTGWGMVTPLGCGVESAWKSLLGGEKVLRSLEGKEWSAFGSPRAGQVLDLPSSEKLARRDRSLRFAVAAAEEAWAMADLARVGPGRIATTFSSSKGGLLSLLSTGFDPSVTWDFLTDFFPHAGGQLLKQWFGFKGPSLSVSSACSTGIGSLVEGIRLLRDGECDVVLAGSTEASIHPLLYAGFRNMGLFSEKEGGPSPFDLERDGFIMGEGAAVLILETHSKAKQRGAKSLAIVSSAVLGGDAHEALEMEPEGRTIVPVIRRSLERAGLSPHDIGYVNAHGTGTRLNDQVESAALAEVFGMNGTYVSSTKGATGHLLGAAGSVEAVLAGLALIKGELPDTRNLQDPDPDCPIRHVEKGGMKKKVDHVMSLSYGFGGQLGAVIFSKA